MKKIIIVLLACIMIMAVVGCSTNSNKHEGEAKTPSGSSVQKGRDYNEVVDDFKSKGFKNIKIEKIEDLITGWVTKDGEVEEVSVGGDADYSADEWVSEDIEVIIKYHTFKEKDTESATEPKVKDTENTTEPKVEDDLDVNKTSEEILTVDNCKDLSDILSTKDEFDSRIKDFAQKYEGKTIEFDGNTAYVSKHGDYKTRFDYLIYAGDYSETTASGPSFQFSNVNYSDLHLTGDNVPDTFGVGLNIRIVAVVGEYDENSGLFQLKPLSIKMR
ncbi:DUF4839 domain-containing protein [Clostridium sp. HCS.1]|uniref:DUF4839 domain-containing protein n=2 Tax=Clostridium sp. HCS.1 TaxID=3238594 RepID=UPI003A4DE430